MSATRNQLRALGLWIAQGCGLGRIPVAPGTWGSLAGLLWLGVLLWPGQVWFYGLGGAVGVGLSVWLCGAAEKALGKIDPPSVVLDEIVAMPLCFAAWLLWDFAKTSRLAGPLDLLRGRTVWLTLGTFVAFRLFDVLKPFPVRQSQRLPGGWGVTVDDVLAALYVNALSLICLGVGLAV